MASPTRSSIPCNPARRTSLTLLASFAVLGAVIVTGPKQAVAADLAEVRVGTNGVVSDAAFFIANRKGYFAEQGIKVTFVPFDAGPKMIAPLGVGQIDVAAGAISAGLFNAAARGIEIKMVADKGSTPPGYDYVPILVRKALVDSGKVKTFKDLKGLKIAEAGKGGSQSSKLNEALKSVGLSYKDVEHEYIGYPQHVPALMNGAVDAAVTTEPSATQAVERGAAVRLSMDKLYPNQEVAALFYGGKFIKDSPELARKFMVAYIKGARVYNDALKGGKFAGPAADEVIKMLAEDSNVKDASLYRKMTPNGINPDGLLNIASLKKDLQFYKDQGYLEGQITVEQVVDDSFAKAALKELGPYRRKD
jgi:NitT/TauT family transport system substrate-binding protein